MSTFLTVIIIFIFTPLAFLIPQLAVRKKWLLAYSLIFSTSTMLIFTAILKSANIYTVNSSPIHEEFSWHGIGSLEVFLLMCLFSIGGASGITSKSIFLLLKSTKKFSTTKWFASSIFLTLIVSIPIVFGIGSLHSYLVVYPIV